MTRKQATIAVRSGLNDDEQYGCVVPPIHLSSTYNFTGFNEPRAHDYSRRGNPTRDVVQRALAELEGGAGAVLTNTGMSAILLVTTVFLKPGDLLVAPHDCYGGSYRLFDSLAKRGCYRVQFVDQSDEQALRAALAEKPKLVLVESPSNPLLRVVDIAKICGLAREAGAISVVDNTFLSPALQNPLALGADLPMIGVSTLATMAQGAWRMTGATRVLAAIDARMGEVYWAEYTRDENGVWHGEETEAVLKPEAVTGRLKQLSGTGWAAWPEMAKDTGLTLVDGNMLLPAAEDMLPIACQLLAAGKTVAVEHAEPVYLRNTVAWKKLPGRE